MSTVWSPPCRTPVACVRPPLPTAPWARVCPRCRFNEWRSETRCVSGVVSHACHGRNQLANRNSNNRSSLWSQRNPADDSSKKLATATPSMEAAPLTRVFASVHAVAGTAREIPPAPAGGAPLPRPSASEFLQCSRRPRRRISTRRPLLDPPHPSHIPGDARIDLIGGEAGTNLGIRQIGQVACSWAGFRGETTGREMASPQAISRRAGLSGMRSESCGDATSPFQNRPWFIT